MFTFVGGDYFILLHIIQHTDKKIFSLFYSKDKK
jgi:hypothetical protein